MPVVLSLFLFFLSTFTAAAPVINIDDSINKLTIDQHIDILDNPGQKLSIDDIINTPASNRFAPIDLTTRSSLDAFGHTLWLRFSISNNTGKAQPLWFTANHNAIASLQLYRLIPPNHYQTIDDAIFQHSDLMPILKELLIPAYTSVTYLVDVRTISSHSLNMTVMKPSVFLPEQLNRSVIYSFALGILAMLALLNLFIALYRQSMLFLFHNCFILANAGVHTAGLGIPRALFSNFGEWQYAATATLLFLSTSASLLCAQEYIKSTRNPNKFYALLGYAQYFNVACSLLLIFLVDGNALLMLLPLALLFPVMISAFLYIYRHNDDTTALWIAITATLCAASFLFLLLFQVSTFSLDALINPAVLYLFVMEAILMTGLLIHHEYLSINEESSQQRILESHEIKHHAQNQLLQEFSGDMQTPLSGIMGMADLLKSSSLTAEQHAKVDAITNSGQALLNKIADIHYRIQLEQNTKSIRKSPFELNLLLENCINSFRLPAETKNIELILQVQPDIPAVVKGDEYRLRQIIIQLIENAIKNTEQGEVLVKLWKNATDNDIIYFSIHDTGRGITKDKIANLTQPSTLLSATEKNLGLNTVTELLAQLKSELLIDSIEGEGSTFSFSLNLPAVDSSNEKNRALDNILKYKKLLIVDDNHTSCKVLKQQANNWGMLVTEAHSGQEALAMYRAKQNLGETFDAIILDYDMPQMDGIEAAEKITLEARENQPIIIMLATLSQFPPEHIAKQAGVDLTLNKPVSQKLLKLTLCNLFHMHKKNERETSLSGHTSLNVLVADDNDVIRSVISKMLESLGIGYRMVSDGKLALDAVKKEHFDVILMDCEMPFMNGFEATRNIHLWQRERHQELTPVIALTAYTLGENKKSSEEAGMVDYLEKPINMTELEAVLQRYQA